MAKEQGQAYWRNGEYGRELVYADGDTCGYAPYWDDFDKDKPCDWCGCRLGVEIHYDYDTGWMFHIGCFEHWNVERTIAEIYNG